MIRFYILLVLFLASLFCVFKAPEYHLWYVAIVVTCYPLVFAVATALVTASGLWVHKWQLTGTVLGVLAFLFYISPVIRAYRVAGQIKADMAKALNGVNRNDPIVFPPDKSPINFARLFKAAKNSTAKTITYVEYRDTSLTLDFYPSLLPGDRPCIINVHGGSWQGGDKSQIPQINAYLASRGYQVAAINYRLAPKWQSPAPVEDVKASIDYFRQHAAEYHVDTSNFVLMGRSAGAQIALLAAYSLHDRAIKGVVDIYGPADMVWGYSLPSSPLILDSRKVMREYIGGSYEDVPEKYKASSPVEWVDKNAPPTLMIHGDNDVWVSPEHNSRLIRKLQPAGVKYYWLRVPWATHAFDYNINGPGGQLATFAIETFLDNVTR